MKKIAFVFPGQGAQHTGMGLDLVEQSQEGKRCFDEGNAVLDFDLYDLCANPEAPIHQTAYTQPALVAVSICLLQALKQRIDIQPDYVAGLSLGEYTALIAAGILSYTDGMKLVRQRGLYMEEAGKNTEGAMAAVVKGDLEHIEELCAKDLGVVGIANYNSPVQVVLSGEINAVQRVSEQLAKEKTRVIPLQVSGAFHSPLMEEASEKFKKNLEPILLKEGNIPYVTNVTGEVITDTSQTKSLLVQQLKGAVQWEKSIRTMIDLGVDTFVEIGPGNTLAGLIKKIDRKVKVLNLNSYESLDLVVRELNGEGV